MKCLKCDRETKGKNKLCGYHRKGKSMAKKKRTKKVNSPAYDMITGLVRYIDQRIDERLKAMLSNLGK